MKVTQAGIEHGKKLQVRYIVRRLKEEMRIPTKIALRLVYRTRIYQELQDTETGYFADSPEYLTQRVIAEIHENTCKQS